MGFNCLNATEPLPGDNLLFATKSPKIVDTHLIDVEKMKNWVDLKAIQWFWILDPSIGNSVY